MGHIVLLLFSFFTEAVILWQYASSLFTSSYSSKIRLALLSALYTILFLLSLLEQTGLNVVSFLCLTLFFFICCLNSSCYWHSSIRLSLQQLWVYLKLQFWGLHQDFFRIFS